MGFMLTLDETRFLGDEMERAIKDFSASGWSADGKIAFVRERMENAYARVRNSVSQRGGTIEQFRG